MTATLKRQYGLWESPVTPQVLSLTKRLGDVQWDTDGSALVWHEARSGAGVLMLLRAGEVAPSEVTGDLNVRAEVGYGGGDFTVQQNQIIFAVHKIGRLYRAETRGGPARPITPSFGAPAAPVVTPDGRFVVYVHHDDGVDRLAVVDIEGRAWPQILTEGHDFYMQPRISPDGRYIAWVAWDHPRMPWDGSSLLLARLLTNDSGLPRLGDVRLIAGGETTSIFQPEFDETSKRLYFMSDASGHGNLWCADLDCTDFACVQLTDESVEYDTPAWVQGMRTYALLRGRRQAMAVRCDRGEERLHLIDLDSGASRAVEALCDYGEVAQVTASPDGRRVAFVGSTPAMPPRVVTYDLEAQQVQVVARSSSESLPVEDLAMPEFVSWQSGGDELAFGFFYAPKSTRFEGAGSVPLVVLVHGGPTSHARAGWHGQAQFFATRGFAVLLLNHRGSSGHGRAYAQRLRHCWGICDVQDATCAVTYLGEKNRIDPRKAVIMGGSAGGYTTLMAMVASPSAFAAGISYYGVSDLFQLAAVTHKFEERYTDFLVGPLPEAAEVYRQRSPALNADRMERPLLVFQGDCDVVVPKAQSDAIVAALKRRGVPHAYHVYEGEGHGFRRQETLCHFYSEVEAFLRRHVVYA